MLLALSACATSGAAPPSHPDAPATTNSPSPIDANAMRPMAELLAPDEPPAAIVRIGSTETEPKVVALDWNAAGYRQSQAPPDGRLVWPVATGDSWTLAIPTVPDPARVFMYRYADVGPGGIPDEGSAQESVCSVPEASCTIERTGGNVVVRPEFAEETGYFAVQAAWLTADRKEASVSWVFHIKPPTSAAATG